MFVALAVFIAGLAALRRLRRRIELLTLARVLQGLGGGGLMTLSQALVGEAIPPRERARYQGYLAAVAVCANTFGPVAGGYLTEHFGWPSIFLVNVPIGLGAVALTWRLPRPRSQRGCRGAPTRPGSCCSRCSSPPRCSRSSRSSTSISPRCRSARGLLAVGIVALVLLVRQENRAPSPLIPLKLLRQPAIWHSDALAACHGAALVSLITFLPVYLEVVRGASPSATGLLLVPLTIGIGVGSLVTGRLVNKTGLTTVFPVGGSRLGHAQFRRPRLLGTGTRHRRAVAGLLLWNGLFMGTVMGVVQVSVQSAAGPRAARRGRRLGAILAIDRRRLRHRGGGDRAVRHADAAQSGSRARLCRDGPARPCRDRRCRRSRRPRSRPISPSRFAPPFCDGRVHHRPVFSWR